MEHQHRNHREEHDRAEQPGKQAGHKGQPASRNSQLTNQNGPTRAGSPYKGRPVQEGNGTRRTKREWRDML